MRQAYNDNVDNFDLYSGVLAEQPLKGGNLGYVAAKIVG